MIDMHPHFAYELARQHGEDLQRRRPARRWPWQGRGQPATPPQLQRALRLVGSPPPRVTDDAGARHVA